VLSRGELMGHQCRRITLTETQTCHVCGKRFRNQNAFARMPSGKIVHYTCMTDDKASA